MNDDARFPEAVEDYLSSAWRRVKEHRIAQWTVGYVAVAYGIQHAITLTADAFEWPNAAIRISMILLALGLPIALTLAWYHGKRASRRATGGEMAIVSVMLVGISLIFYLFVRPTDIAARTPAVQQVSLAAAGPANNSLAVLPLANVSGDKDQEFFSDGMTDAIMSALAKVAALRVVGRESAFEFKGKSQNDRVIGRALGARYLVEGSVLKLGERVRITAQLVRAEDGVSLWTENYDRELTDIFAVEDDVARAIVASLQIPLGLKKGESLVPSRTPDTDNYQDYLRAKAMVRARGATGNPLAEPIALLEQVVSRDPAYAPAWALLAQAYSLAPTFDSDFNKSSVEQLRRVVTFAIAKAEAAAARAIALDPRSADGYVAMGMAQGARGELLNAEDSFARALALEPLNPEALHRYSPLVAATGRLRKALAMRQQLRSIEPLPPVYNRVTARIFLIDGRSEEALAIAKPQPSTYDANRRELARIYASLGRYKEAAEEISGLPRAGYDPGAVELATRLLSAAPAPVPRGDLPRLGNLSFVFVYAGAPERALEFDEQLMEAGFEVVDDYSLFWQADYRPVRKTERFKALMRKAGFVDYWRARGWPDLCRPTTGDDFECS